MTPIEIVGNLQNREPCEDAKTGTPMLNWKANAGLQYSYVLDYRALRWMLFKWILPGLLEKMVSVVEGKPNFTSHAWDETSSASR